MSSTMSREAAAVAMFREANRRRTRGAKIANTNKTASSPFGAGWIFGVRDVAETGQSRTVDGILVEPHTAQDILAAVDREPSLLDMPFARVFDAAVGATFASRKTSAQSVTPDSLNSWVEFDHPFVVHADGTVSEASGVYAPSVYSYGGGDVEIDGSGWEFWSTGRSGQHSYRGPVMHPSEQLSGGLARDLLAEPGVYTVTEAMDPEDMDNLVGWVVLKSTTRTASRKGSGGKGGPSRRKTSSSINVIDLEVCSDCLMAAANGYDPHEWGRTANPEPWAEWDGYPGQPVAGDGEGHFSRQMCEGCGSRLAGDRHQAHWLEPKTATRKTSSLKALAAKVQVGAQDAPALKAMASLKSVDDKVRGLTGRQIIAHVLATGQMDEDTRKALSRMASGERSEPRKPRPLHAIAQAVRDDWGNVSPAAAPHLDAMSVLESADDTYGADSARTIVSRFLANSTDWRGKTAHQIKGELKAL